MPQLVNKTALFEQPNYFLQGRPNLDPHLNMFISKNSENTIRHQQWLYLSIWYQSEAKLKKMFVWHCLPRVSLGGSVGRHFFFFLNIYYLHMDGNGKKIKKSQIWRKKKFE